MLLNLSFPQGVDALLDSTYVRPTTDDQGNSGLFVMDAATGSWSVKFKNINFMTVSFDQPGVVVGIASDNNGFYAYRADLNGNAIEVLGRLPTLPSYSLLQGDYTYDQDKNVIYWAGSKGDHSGWVSIDLDTKAVQFKAVSPQYNVMMVDGNPVGFTVPQEYSYSQGVGTFNPSTRQAYVPSWQVQGEDYGPFGIVVMKFENGKFAFKKFIEVGADDYISNITYDTYSGKFFGERNLGSHEMELVAIDLTGEVFTLGTSSGNTYEGDGGNDYYMGLGGNDVIFGDLGDDELEGGVGNDTVKGGVGRDTLSGGDGNDTLDGGKDGAKDTLNGGSGDDTYVVHEGETVRESSKQGNDTVKTSTSYTLGSNLEKLILTGTANLNGTGNTLANTITGNAAANALTGGAGADKLVSGGGDDKLYGGAGIDSLYGGGGKDAFIFKSVSELAASITATDTIFDFSQLDHDVIDLSVIDANSKVVSSQAFSFLGTGSFHKKAGELRYEKKSSDTYVYGDTDGDGKANFTLHFDDALNLTKADFLL